MIDERITLLYIPSRMDTDPAAEFRIFLTEWLRTSGYSQYQLSLAAHIGQSLISRWLHPTVERQTRPDPKTLRKLSEVVGRSYDELMRMSGYQDAPTARRETDDPPELAALLADVRAGWHVADPVVRQLGADVTRAAFHVPRARRSRGGSGDNSGSYTGQDKPKRDSRKHIVRA